ncbi:MAG: hypothetical protein R2838_24775 [Caldilineaceae bacterium]
MSLEAIKLLESGRMLTLCDEVWVVTSTRTMQLRRLVDQRGMDEEAARQRMAPSRTRAQKIAQADLCRQRQLAGTCHAQLDDLWDGLLNRARSKRSMDMIKRFWSDRTVLANWLVLAVGMVLILFISARHVGSFTRPSGPRSWVRPSCWPTVAWIIS